MEIGDRFRASTRRVACIYHQHRKKRAKDITKSRDAMIFKDFQYKCGKQRYSF